MSPFFFINCCSLKFVGPPGPPVELDIQCAGSKVVNCSLSYSGSLTVALVTSLA